jgi:hypothetical protein
MLGLPRLPRGSIGLLVGFGTTIIAFTITKWRQGERAILVVEPSNAEALLYALRTASCTLPIESKRSRT